MKPFAEKLSFDNPLFPVLTFFLHRSAHDVTPSHWHDEIEVLYVLEGRVTVMREGREDYIDEGELVLINGGESHSVSASDNTRLLLLQFGLELVRPAFPESAESRGFTSLINGIHYPVPLCARSGAGRALAARMLTIHELYTSMVHQHAGSELQYLIRGELYQIAGLLLNQFGHLQKPRESYLSLRRMNFMQRAAAFVEQHLTTPVTNQEAARAFHVSPRHFSTLFKTYAGVTFKEYLLSSRIHLASELLQTDMRVTEIAHACGFNDLNTFNRVFKKHKQQTPTAYRNALHANGQNDGTH
jgi:AraC-like DNA-binding protein